MVSPSERRARTSGGAIAPATTREHGAPDLAPRSTILGHLTRLRTGVDRWSWLALALILAGMGLRLAAAFPPHKYPADADVLLTGLCAERVLRGDPPVFFSSVRIGSLECLMAAPMVAALGPTRLPLALASLLLALAALVVGHRMACTLFDRRLACLVLLFLALPPPAMLFWTSMLNGYPMVLLLCLSTLWLAARIDRDGVTAVGSGLLGLAVGLGFWHSFLTLAASLPALAWLGWRRGAQVLRNPRAVAAGGLLFLAGAAPWVAFNLRWDLASLRYNFAGLPVGGGGAALDNARYLLTDLLPELAASADPTRKSSQALLATGLRPLALAIAGVAAAAFLVLPAFAWRRRELRRLLPGWVLLAGVVGCTTGLYVFSAAGQLRGLMVRYVLPLWPVLAVALAFLLAALTAAGGRGRIPAVAVASSLLLFDFAVYQLPWTPQRQGLVALAVADQRLLEQLAARHVDMVLGSYWMVYPLAYLSGGTVRGVPCELQADPYSQRQAAQRQVPRRWALVSGWWTRGELEQWAAAAGLEGRVESVADRYALLVPDNLPPHPGVALLDRTLAACVAHPAAGP